jgi:hypothetical protein
MWKKLVVIMLAVTGIASASNAGTEVIRDYGRDQYNTYAPRPLPPPRPVYYAPPPPVVIYPRPFFFGFGFHHRYYPRRFHHWR